jgi:hypothetical protein
MTIVLVIEDHRDLSKANCSFLESKGFETIAISGIRELQGDKAIAIAMDHETPVEIDLRTIAAATVDFQLVKQSLHGTAIATALAALGIPCCSASSNCNSEADLKMYSRYGICTYLEFKCLTESNWERVAQALGLMTTIS